MVGKVGNKVIYIGSMYDELIIGNVYTILYVGTSSIFPSDKYYLFAEASDGHMKWYHYKEFHLICFGDKYGLR